MPRSEESSYSSKVHVQIKSSSDVDVGNVRGSLNILDEIHHLYEERMTILDADISSNNDHLKISTLRLWVSDLYEQNLRLVRSLEELEQEIVGRVMLIEEKYQVSKLKTRNFLHQAENLHNRQDSNGRDEIASYETLVYQLNSDLANLCTLIQSGLESYNWNTKRFSFHKVTDDDIFGPKLITFNYLGNCQSSNTNERPGKDETTIHLEAYNRDIQEVVPSLQYIEDIFFNTNKRDNTSSVTVMSTQAEHPNVPETIENDRELCERQQDELDSVRRELEELTHRASQNDKILNARLEEQQDTREEYSKRLRDLEEQLIASRKDVQILQLDLREKERLLLTAAKRYKDDVNTVQEQSERLISQGNDLNKRNLKILTLKSENRDLTNKIKVNDEEFRQLSIREKCQQMLCSCSSKEEKIKALQIEMQNTRQELQVSAESLRLLVKKNAKLQREIILTNEDMEHHKKQLKYYMTEFEDNKKQFACLTNSIFLEQQRTVEAVTVANNKLEIQLAYCKMRGQNCKIMNRTNKKMDLKPNFTELE